MNFEFTILDWFQSIHCAPLDALAGTVTGLVFGFAAAKLVDALAAHRIAKH